MVKQQFNFEKYIRRKKAMETMDIFDKIRK